MHAHSSSGSSDTESETICLGQATVAAQAPRSMLSHLAQPFVPAQAEQRAAPQPPTHVVQGQHPAQPQECKAEKQEGPKPSNVEEAAVPAGTKEGQDKGKDVPCFVLIADPTFYIPPRHDDDPMPVGTKYLAASVHERMPLYRSIGWCAYTGKNIEVLLGWMHTYRVDLMRHQGFDAIAGEYKRDWISSEYFLPNGQRMRDVFPQMTIEKPGMQARAPETPFFLVSSNTNERLNLGAYVDMSASYVEICQHAPGAAVNPFNPYRQQQVLGQQGALYGM